MDRFVIFKTLQQLIHESQALFEHLDFNPIDVLLSPIYIEIINHSQQKYIKKSSSNIWSHVKGLAQIYLRPVKHVFTPKSNEKVKGIQKPIIFFPTEPNHVIQFTPVWAELEKKNIKYLILTTKRHIFENQKKINRPIIWITPFGKKISVKGYSNFSENIQKFIGNKVGSTNENALILNTIERISSNQLKYIHSLSKRVQKILDDYLPIAVVPGYDITPEGRLLTVLAKKRNIPSYCIMHGSITGEPLDTMHIVDHFCLFGEAAKRDLIEKGAPAEQLVVTGAPYLDHFHHQQTGIHPILKNKLSLSDDKPYFLIAMSGPGHSTSYAHFQLLLETIFSTASRFPSAQWVIKMHPKDRLANYHNILHQNPNHSIHIIEHTYKGFPTSIFEWLQGATALITGSSTVALEAMSINIPVVTMDLMSEYQKVDFIDLDTTVHVSKNSELQVVISNLLSSDPIYDRVQKNAYNYISDYFYKPDNSASENIVKLLYPNHIS